ncbi:hypothetical protein F4819DRAFT_469072 [Hypoxylon fuscum]|nr:hypothetical protein F4819DRAFT_469072 [Hypoxylon fuscum]
MKFSVKAISLIATSMFIPAIWASPVAEVGLESRAGVVPPAKGQSYRCDTSDSSPELDPLLKAAMAFINRKGQTCQQSNSKSTTQMYNRDGARVIAGGNTGNFDCASVGYVIYSMISNCMLDSLRVGGASYNLDKASGTWISVSKSQ